ncbi:MAG: GFA family protein [Rugosibacter sp.]|nr:GFA family protein [Rugosibacter sp.]
MEKIHGQCLCGAIRYTSAAAPLMTATCHCKHCQRQTGTAFSIVVAVPKGSLVFETGQPATYQDVGDSGLPVFRHFCANCGSPIVTEVDAMPTMDFLKAGTLDDTSWLKPQMNIWCTSAQPWVKMDESIPCIPGNPPAA